MTEISEAVWQTLNSPIQTIRNKRAEVERFNAAEQRDYNIKVAWGYNKAIAQPQFKKDPGFAVAQYQIVMLAFMTLLSPSQICYRTLELTKHETRVENKYHYWFTFKRGDKDVIIPIMNIWDMRLLHCMIDLTSMNPESPHQLRLAAPPRRVLAIIADKVPEIYARLQMSPLSAQWTQNLWRLRYDELSSYGIDSFVVRTYVAPHKKIHSGKDILNPFLMDMQKRKVIMEYDYSTD